MKFLIVLVVLGVTTSSFAQRSPNDTGDSTSAAKVPLARRLWEEGVEAVNKGRWSLAHERFKASYELSPRVLTLFNLAGAQVQTSRFVEASESYRRFLRETADGRYPELRGDATSALESVEKQVGQLTLDVANIERGDTITLDEVEFPPSALREPFPMNPGAHIVVVTRGGAKVVTKTVTLAAGAAERLTVEVPRRVDLQIRTADPGRASSALFATPSSEPTRKSEGGLLKSPWFWTAVVVVVAGGATGAYFLTRPTDDALVVRRSLP